MMQRVLFHIPHDGTACPDELMKSVCVPKNVFDFYQDKMQDKDVSTLVPPGYEALCFNVSRLLCDVERFADSREVMEQFGMGFCYEKAYDGTVIKAVTEQVKKDAMKYYTEHHHRLDELSLQNHLFVIDLHSFSDDIVVKSSTPPPYADICIGYDDEFCPDLFAQETADLFRNAGYTVSENTPYAGSLVPNAAIRDPSLECRSIMVEINKRVYCPQGVAKRTEAEALKKLLGQVAFKAAHFNSFFGV